MFFSILAYYLRPLKKNALGGFSKTNAASPCFGTMKIAPSWGNGGLVHPEGSHDSSFAGFVDDNFALGRHG